jgi:dTDP-4-amino-4,6-dideoxygalactose transaminase
MNRIPFQRPRLPAIERIEAYFTLSRNAHWFSNDGPCARMLNERLASYVGCSVHCTIVSSGTSGLMVALRAAVGPEPTCREVIVPSFTYIASVSAILWSGLTPVFADVAADHWHLDPMALDLALREREGRVAAVLACSTFGCAPPVAVTAAWEEACRQAGVPLVVDSAAGFGSRDELGRALGRQGAAEVFSFHATKTLAIGEGGAVFTADRDLSARMAQQARFGLDSERVLAGSPGLNAKMSELHAATALAALDDLGITLEARAARAEAICDGLEEHGFSFQVGCETSAWQFVPALAPNAEVRREIIRASRSAAVQVRDYHQPLHRMPHLRQYARIGSLPVTSNLSAERCRYRSRSI